MQQENVNYQTPVLWDWKYAVLKKVVNVSFLIFHRQSCVTGRENIPAGGRLIFAANHQNGLIDPLAVIMTTKYQPVYLARADIFKNPFFSVILRFLRIMPVYRLRDGVESMGKNEETFDKTASHLSGGGCIGIMPEGNHHNKKRLRELKKGIFRIAFRAAEIGNTMQDIKIVPVGLNYRNTSGLFGELVVNYGKPLSVAGYRKSYQMHPQSGINKMKKDLAASLSSLMLDVKDEKNYHEDKLIINMGSRILLKKVTGDTGNANRKFLAERSVCQSIYDYYEKDPSGAGRLRAKCTRLLELLDSCGLSPENAKKAGKGRILFLKLIQILSFPVFMAGFILHFFPVLTIHLVLKKLKDPQFISSFKFVMGTLLIPLNYLGLGLGAFLCLPPLYAILIMVLTPVTGILGYFAYKFSQRISEIIRFNNLCRADREFESEFTILKSSLNDDFEPLLSVAGERFEQEIRSIAPREVCRKILFGSWSILFK